MTKKHEPIPRHELREAIDRSDRERDRGYFSAGELATLLAGSLALGSIVAGGAKLAVNEFDHKPDNSKNIEVVVQTPEEPTVIYVHTDK